MKKVQQVIKMQFTARYYWCDSTVVLSWLRAEPTRWKTFVTNRVSVVQENSSVVEWNHISSELNPADIVSRDASPDALIQSQLWWHGPNFLLQNSSNWPTKALSDINDNVPEVKTITKLNLATVNDVNICERFSSLSKLQRVVAFMLRFIHNIKARNCDKPSGKLTVNELNYSRNTVTKLVQ